MAVDKSSAEQQTCKSDVIIYAYIKICVKNLGNLHHKWNQVLWQAGWLAYEMLVSFKSLSYVRSCRSLLVLFSQNVALLKAFHG